MRNTIFFAFSVVVIKRGAVVEADKNFSSQLRLMNLSDGSPYETLHAIVSNAVAPYFKSYVRATGKADRYIVLWLHPPFLVKEFIDELDCFGFTM